jgi:hypothetical protein
MTHVEQLIDTDIGKCEPKVIDSAPGSVRLSQYRIRRTEE